MPEKRKRKKGRFYPEGKLTERGASLNENFSLKGADLRNANKMEFGRYHNLSLKSLSPEERKNATNRRVGHDLFTTNPEKKEILRVLSFGKKGKRTTEYETRVARMKEEDGRLRVIEEGTVGTTLNPEAADELHRTVRDAISDLDHTDEIISHLQKRITGKKERT